MDQQFTDIRAASQKMNGGESNRQNSQNTSSVGNRQPPQTLSTYAPRDHQRGDPTYRYDQSANGYSSTRQGKADHPNRDQTQRYETQHGQTKYDAKRHGDGYSSPRQPSSAPGHNSGNPTSSKAYDREGYNSQAQHNPVQSRNVQSKTTGQYNYNASSDWIPPDGHTSSSSVRNPSNSNQGLVDKPPGHPHSRQGNTQQNQQRSHGHDQNAYSLSTSYTNQHTGPQEHRPHDYSRPNDHPHPPAYTDQAVSSRPKDDHANNKYRSNESRQEPSHRTNDTQPTRHESSRPYDQHTNRPGNHYSHSKSSRPNDQHPHSKTYKIDPQRHQESIYPDKRDPQSQQSGPGDQYSRSQYGGQSEQQNKSNAPGTGRHPHTQVNRPDESNRTRDHAQSNRAMNEPKRHAPTAPNTQSCDNQSRGDKYNHRDGERGTAGMGPQAPPRGSSKDAVQIYEPQHNQGAGSYTKGHPNFSKTDDFRNRQQEQNTTAGDVKISSSISKGFANEGYMLDDSHVQIHKSPNTAVRYKASAPPNDNFQQKHDIKNGRKMPSNSHQQDVRKKYSSTTAINSSNDNARDFQRDPLQNPYAIPPAGSAPNKYGSMSALQFQTSSGSVSQTHTPSGANSKPDYHGTSQIDYHTTASSSLPSYNQTSAMPQGRTFSELQAKALADPSHGQKSPQGHQEGRRYEKKVSGNQHAQPPRKTKRGRILSQYDQTQQRSLGQGPPQGNPGGFNAAPPMRAQSVSDLHISMSADLNSTGTNLHRPQSVPNISGAVQFPDMCASTTSLAQNGHANGGTGLWKSKSLLDLALTSQNGNLQRSKSLTSLIVANPNLARTASTYALYEMQVEKGLVPKDQQQTFILSCIACGLFFPTGIPLIILTKRNERRWKECLQDAITINNRLFWGSIATIVFGAVLWVVIIVLISLHFG